MASSFPNGTLLLPRDLPPDMPVPEVWASNPVIVAMVGAFVLAAVFSLKSITSVMPSVTACIFTPKANIRLEHSINLAILRNRTALILMIPLSLLCDRFGLYLPRFAQGAGPGWSAIVILAVLLAARLLHSLLSKALFSRSKLDADRTSAVCHAYLNFWTASTVLMLASAALLSVFNTGEPVIRTVLYAEAGALFILQCGSIFEILRFGYNAFVSFLYLCALEFLPVGLMAVSAAVL